MTASHDSSPSSVATALLPSSDRVVEFLRRPSAYGESTSEVRLLETHISWVFLTDRHAYKLKKPVRFDFLDFSTVALRATACQREVELNRRLAPDVYRSVVPVTMTRAGNLRLGDGGPPVDWVVKMRRLPEDRALDRLIRARLVTDADLDRIATRLSDFYRGLPPLSLRTDEYRRRVEEHVANNHRELLNPRHDLPLDRVGRVYAAQLRVLRLYPELLDHRVCDGRIIEGHGDLRPEHIYVTSQVNVIDCIEFNSGLRQIDVLDELSFLAVECDALGAPEIGGRLLDRYCQLTGDQPARELLAFYRGYRATVRAKVSALRAAQLPDDGGDGRPKQAAREAARNYLLLADRQATELRPPLALIVRGLSGAGKSTLAEALAQSLGIELVSTDRLRSEICGPATEPGAYGVGRYRPDQRDLVYQEMFRRAQQILQSKGSVVLDGTFLTTRLRAQAMLMARHNDALPMLVHCHCPDEVAQERTAARYATQRAQSEARPEFVARQRLEEESDPVGSLVCEIDTTSSLPDMLALVFKALRGALDRM